MSHFAKKPHIIYVEGQKYKPHVAGCLLSELSRLSKKKMLKNRPKCHILPKNRILYMYRAKNTNRMLRLAFCPSCLGCRKKIGKMLKNRPKCHILPKNRILYM